MYLKRVAIKGDCFPTREVYPFNQSLLQNSRSVSFEKPITFFAGENGTGKSTLLTAICRKCGITMWRDERNLRVIRNPHEDRLFQYVELEWAQGPVSGAYFGSDIFRTFAENLEEWASSDPGLLKYFGGKSLLVQSHGQSLMSYFRSRYQVKGLYLLDEPETALSPSAQIALLHLLQELSQKGNVQFIIATHSPILLACEGADIYSFDGPSIAPTLYTDTPAFKVYRDFMLNIPGIRQQEN